MRRIGMLGTVLGIVLVGGACQRPSRMAPTLEQQGVLMGEPGKSSTLTLMSDMGEVQLSASPLLFREQVEIPVEVKGFSDHVPGGFVQVSPVVHLQFDRSGIAMNDPRVSSLLGLGVGVDISLPVSGGYEEYKGLVEVNGHLFGVYFDPKEVSDGVARIRVPVGLYFSMFYKDAVLEVDVFVVAPAGEGVDQGEARLQGGIVEMPGLTGIYVADRTNAWGFRWVPRLYRSIPIGSVTIPATDLHVGLVRPLRLLFVHGFGVIYHNSNGWIGPDPDETWGQMVSHLTTAGDILRRTEILAFNHSFIGVGQASQDLRRALGQIGAQLDRGTPERYVLVGHSMGGLIVRNFYSPSEHFPAVVTLGSPLHGSFLADLVLQLAEDQEFYVTQLASYMATEVVQQCAPSQFQDPIQDFLQPYINQLANAKVALDGIFWVASKQGLLDLTYDWSEPLHFYVPRLDCFVSLDPDDPDFPSQLRRGQRARNLNQRDQNASSYLYLAFSDPYGSNDMFYNFTSAVLASFHNNYERRVVPNVRRNDGLVWVKSARNDYGPVSAVVSRWSISEARGNHTALRTVQATANRILGVLQAVDQQWRQSFPGFVVAMGWGTYNSAHQNLMEWATNYFTKNLDLAVFYEDPSDNRPSYLPLVGYLQEGSVLPPDQWQRVYGGRHFGDVETPAGPEWVAIDQPRSGTYYVAVRKTHNGLASPFFEPSLNQRTVRVGIFGAGQDTVIGGPSSWPSDHLWWVVAKIQGNNVTVINATAPETTVVDTIYTPGASVADTVVTRRMIRWRDGGRLVLTTEEHKTPICENPGG